MIRFLKYFISFFVLDKRSIWGAILLFIPYLRISKMYFWISIIHFWISKNWFIDILKYIFGYPKISWLLYIHNSIFRYPKMNYEYPKIYPNFLISINQFLDIQKSVEYWMSIIQSVEYWMSIIQLMDIQNWIMDIQKSNYGYPKFSIIFGYLKMYFRIYLNMYFRIS